MKISDNINTAAVFHNVEIRNDDEVTRHGEVFLKGMCWAKLKPSAD